MLFLIVSFVAGFLTALAPCLLPLLPVIVGGSLSDTRSKIKPLTISLSLSLSVILFTLVLKFATIFIYVSPVFWQYVSGGILVVFGCIYLFPGVWERVAARFNLWLGRKSQTILADGVKKESLWGDIIIGASLGPVFSSCSPTYFVILAVVLPTSFALGLVYLVFYSAGLCLALFLISYFGQLFVEKLDYISDNRSTFKKVLGVLFVIIGIFVITGFDKKIQSSLVSGGVFDVTRIEKYLLKDKEAMPQNVTSNASKALKYEMYKEFVNPSDFVNSNKFNLADIVGKKVILLDVMTYSCINCQRTFPYLNAWYEKYEDKGLEIIAIHTPEFAFEKVKKNVEDAMKQFGIKFPVVMDNDYGTWNAYNNQYWPRKYLIDIDGYIVYDHIGEGDYDETETAIKNALEERANRIGDDVDEILRSNVSVAEGDSSLHGSSRETYFGDFRNSEFFGNVSSRGAGDFVFPDDEKLVFNKFYLDGSWKISDQYIEAGDNAKLAFRYDATKVHLVAESDESAKLKVQNGSSDNLKYIDINKPSLYTIIDNGERLNGIFYLTVPKGMRLYALTFS